MGACQWSRTLYQAYQIGDDGHIVGRIDLCCLDDASAKELARQLVRGRPIELWDGACLIKRFEPFAWPRRNP